MSAVSEKFITWLDENAYDYFFTYWISEMDADTAYTDYLLERYDAGEQVSLAGVIDDILRDEEALDGFFQWLGNHPKWSSVFEDAAFTHFEQCGPDEDLLRMDR